MRITELQLRRIVRKLVREAAGEIPAEAKTALDAAADALGDEMKIDAKVLETLARYKDEPWFSDAVKKSSLDGGQVKQLMVAIKQASAEVY